MKFSIIINKQANFYFFVQNLSEWHFSCRKSYNDFWEKELGKFSPEEKEALKQFKKIHLHYSFGKNYLGRYFFKEKNPWENLESKINKKDYDDIKSVFSLLEKKFEIIYDKDYPKLQIWKNILEKKLDNHKDEINNALAILYNTKPLNKDIDIYLLLSSDTKNGGGASIDEKSITVEISRTPNNQLTLLIGLIWHELIHLYFEKGYFIEFLKQEFKDDGEKINLTREIAASLLLPKGTLGKMILGIYGENLNSRISINNQQKLLELTSSYIKEKNKFDKKYINEAKKAI